MKGKTFLGAIMLIFGFLSLENSDPIQTKLFLIGVCALGIILMYKGINQSTREKRERKAREKEELERQRKEEALREAYKRENRERSTKSVDGVELLSFSSSNNLLTAGNNLISFQIRNKNSYDVRVSLSFRYGDNWESHYKDITVRAGRIELVETGGKAWNKAKDVRIDSVY